MKKKQSPLQKQNRYSRGEQRQRRNIEFQVVERVIIFVLKQPGKLCVSVIRYGNMFEREEVVDRLRKWSFRTGVRFLTFIVEKRAPLIKASAVTSVIDFCWKAAEHHNC